MSMLCRIRGHDWKHLGTWNPDDCRWEYAGEDHHICRRCRKRSPDYPAPPIHIACWWAFRQFWSCWWTSTRMSWFKPSEVPWWCYLLAATVNGPAFGLQQASGHFALRRWPAWMWSWMVVPEGFLMDREFYWWLESHITGYRVVPQQPMASWTGPSPDPPMHSMSMRVRRDLYDRKNPPRAYVQVHGAQVVTRTGIPLDTWGNAIGGE